MVGALWYFRMTLLHRSCLNADAQTWVLDSVLLYESWQSQSFYQTIYRMTNEVVIGHFWKSGYESSTLNLLDCTCISTYSISNCISLTECLFVCLVKAMLIHDHLSCAFWKTQFLIIITQLLAVVSGRCAAIPPPDNLFTICDKQLFEEWSNINGKKWFLHSSVKQTPFFLYQTNHEGWSFKLICHSSNFLIKLHPSIVHLLCYRRSSERQSRCSVVSMRANWI